MNTPQLRQVAGCKNGNCPKVYTSGDTVFVQGTVNVSDRFRPTADETVVEIPLDILLEAAEEVQL